MIFRHSSQRAMQSSATSHVRHALVVCAVIAVALIVVASGCRSSSNPYRTQSNTTRNTTKAEQLNREAADSMSRGEWEEAEHTLREALVNDLYFGPAHNNLGIVHLKQGNLYEAATEFEWARKMMPGHPDPRVNLAMVLEQVGKPDDAVAAYRSALEVYPDHIGATQGLVRLQLHRGQTDDTTKHMLEEVAIRGENVQWQDWARLELAKRDSKTNGRKPEVLNANQ